MAENCKQNILLVHHNFKKKKNYKFDWENSDLGKLFD